ncbi:MAG: peptide ABC transporter substrate-binding protein, partial [Acidimicrobiia bacterium]
LFVAACGSGTVDTTTDGSATTEPGAATTDATTGTTADGTATTQPAGSGEAGSGGEFIAFQWQGPSQINSYISTGTKDLLAGSLVLEPLAEISPAGELVPALAAEIPSQENGGIAEDFSSITWTLKEGVLWSDGTPFTADDVVFSWEYCADEATGCSADFSTVESVVADDDLTVTINFTEPQPYPFIHFVSFLYPVIQRAQFQDCVGAGSTACTEQNFSPVGTGPYVVTDLVPEDVVSYEINPNYRGIPEGKPFFGTVTIEGGGDAESTARSVLEIGEGDYAWNLQVAPEIIAPMEAAGNGVVKVAFTANVEHINFNQTDPADDADRSVWAADGSNGHPVFFENPDLIRALSMAINREELVAVGYGPAGRATCNIWPVEGAALSTNMDWCLTQDIDGANALLDEIGAVDSDGDGVREYNGIPLEFDYVTSTNAVRQSNQALIEDYWSQIGVVANMRNEDAGLFFDGTCAADACIWKFFTDIEMFTNGPTNPDPQSYMAGYAIDQIPTADNWAGGGNVPRYASEEYDALLAELEAASLDDPARNELVIQLNDLLVQSGAVVPLIYRGSVSGFANTIQGVGDLNGWDSEYWNIEEWTRG